MADNELILTNHSLDIWSSFRNPVNSLYLLVIVSQLNPGQVGFYRVQYSSAMLERLLPAIRDNSLPPRDRLGLQSDLFALVNKNKFSLIFFPWAGISEFKVMFTPYKKAFESAGKSYRVEFLFTHKKGDIGAIFVSERIIE